MSMQNKTFFCKVVFDGPEYIVNKQTDILKMKIKSK